MFIYFVYSLLLILFNLFFPFLSIAQSVGQSCSINGRTQLSATISEGLMQCRSGIWVSATQTVGSSSQQINAIMNYDKTLITTVDLCTDNIIGFKGFDPETRLEKICGGNLYGWLIPETTNTSLEEKCFLAESKSGIGLGLSITSSKMSGCNSTQFCSIENPRKMQTSNGVATGSFYIFNSTKSMDKFCKNLGFTRGYAGLSSGCTNITITGGQPIAHYENGASWTYTNGDAITSNIGCY